MTRDTLAVLAQMRRDRRRQWASAVIFWGNCFGGTVAVLMIVWVVTSR